MMVVVIHGFIDGERDGSVVRMMVYSILCALVVADGILRLWR
jgi:hypothetical protein